MNTIIERINELRASGLTDTKVKAYLTLEDFSAKEITAAFKELGGSKKPGFKARYFDYLAEAPRTLEEIESYILGTNGNEPTSDNVIKNMSNFRNIGLLASRIFALKNDTKEESVEPEAEVDEDLKAAWEHINKAWNDYESGKRVAKTKVHPDRVAKFKNEELTKRYTELFQKLNEKKAA